MDGAHPDVKRALSVVIDIDDVGESEMRRQKIEDVIRQLKQEAPSRAFRFVYRFSLEERGWNVVFALVVEPEGCFLRPVDADDYIENRWMSTLYLRQIQKRREENMTIQLPPISKIATNDLLCGVETFLVSDVMSE